MCASQCNASMHCFLYIFQLRCYRCCYVFNSLPAKYVQRIFNWFYTRILLKCFTPKRWWKLLIFNYCFTPGARLLLVFVEFSCGQFAAPVVACGLFNSRWSRLNPRAPRRNGRVVSCLTLKGSTIPGICCSSHQPSWSSWLNAIVVSQPRKYWKLSTPAELKYATFHTHDARA